MTPQEAVSFIQSSGGKIFAVEFTKRTTGELRTMQCRTGVYSHLRGGPQAYNPDDHGLVVVFDMAKNSYRSIPIDGITRLKIKGEWHPISTSTSGVQS